MKLSLLFALALFLSARVLAQETSVLGIWYNTEKTSKIKLFKATNGKYYGKIIWLDQPDKKDINNPDPSKHNDPVMNMLIVKDFTWDAGASQWSGGTIYDPDNGKTYDCYMWFDNNNTELLHLKGYVLGMRFLGREVEWTRTEL